MPTWELLRDPAIMAAVTMIVMVVLFKPGIRLLMRAIKPDAPEDWPLEKFVINVVTVIINFFTGYFLLGRAMSGELYVLTVIASGLCVEGYEGLKNLLATRGIDISKIGLLGTQRGSS